PRGTPALRRFIIQAATEAVAAPDTAFRSHPSGSDTRSPDHEAKSSAGVAEIEQRRLSLVNFERIPIIRTEAKIYLISELILISGQYPHSAFGDEAESDQVAVARSPNETMPADFPRAARWEQLVGGRH